MTAPCAARARHTELRPRPPLGTFGVALDPGPWAGRLISELEPGRCPHLAPGERGTLASAAPGIVRCAVCLEALHIGSKWNCDRCWSPEEVLWDLTVDAPDFVLTLRLCLSCTCREVDLT